MRLLFVGDVVGSPGRRVLEETLPALRERHSPDWIVVNGENSAGGLGVTEKTAKAFFEMGADAITLGNHAYRHRDAYAYLDEERRIVRPGNYVKGNPGRGHTVIERDIARAELTLADEVFLVGTAAELTPVREIDDIAIGPPGEVTKGIATVYDDALHGRAERYAKWLDPVPVPSKA